MPNTQPRYTKTRPKGLLDQKIRDDIIIVKLLALALTNLVLDLANLVTNLAKQSLGQPHHHSEHT